MGRGRATNRWFAVCLIVSAVLVLGIVQWSFLPILVQCAPLPGKILLEDSSSHTSKFAAPFKCLFGDALEPCIPPSGISGPRITLNFFHRTEEPTPDWQDMFLSQRQMRAPPTA